MILNILFYVLIFCLGVTFGSFFTLAVHRIPLKQDITHERSYCPKCKHKLAFGDLIPVISYILLGGKCRYCKEKIRSRYFLLEIFSGIVFVLFALSIHLDLFYLSTETLIYFGVGVIYIATLFIIAGIDKEYRKVEKSVVLFQFLVVSCYMMYLYILEGDVTNIYRYVIYLVMMMGILCIHTMYLRKKSKSLYPLEILLLICTMGIFCYEYQMILTIILTLLLIGSKIAIQNLIRKTKTYCKKDEPLGANIPFAFWLVCANIFVLLVTNLNCLN